MKGRKRHIVVDTLGLPLAVAVHPADIQDRDGARLVLARLLGRFPRLQLIWADGAYGGKLVEWARTVGGWTLELVRRPAQQHTFQVLPRRWVVERTFGWLNLQRRLSKDYEALCETTETWDLHRNDRPHPAQTGPPSPFLDTLLENGKIARYESLGGQQQAHGSTEFIVLRGRPGTTTDDFAYYLSRWQGVRQYAIGQMTGTSGRQRVPVDSLDHLTVPVPPISIQRHIADILCALDGKIELKPADGQARLCTFQAA